MENTRTGAAVASLVGDGASRAEAVQAVAEESGVEWTTVDAAYTAHLDDLARNFELDVR